MSPTTTPAAIIGALLLASPTNFATSAPQSPSPDYLLAVGRTGRVELGTTVDEVYRLFGRGNVRLVDRFKEGLFSPALEIQIAGATAVPAIIADIREWPCGEFSVWGIEVRDPRYRTKEGLGVGSTAVDLRRAYSLTISEAEGAHAATVDTLKMSFSLSREGPPDQQRVTSVWLWPDPEAVRKRRCPPPRLSPVTK